MELQLNGWYVGLGCVYDYNFGSILGIRLAFGSSQCQRQDHWPERHEKKKKKQIRR